MKYVNKLAAAALMAALAIGCGGSAGDRLVLQFISFATPQLQTPQPDNVGPTLAEVDLWPPELCSDGSFEPFSNAQADAIFQNNGGSDISLDTIEIDTRAANVPPVTRYYGSAGFPITGGRCTTGAKCALDADCPVGDTCLRTQSRITFLLFDVGTLDNPGVKRLASPGTFEIPITFSGLDDSETRFTVRTSLTASFNNFANCPGGH